MTSVSGLRRFRLVPSMVLATMFMTACATVPPKPPIHISKGDDRVDPKPVDPTPTPTPKPTPGPDDEIDEIIDEKAKYVTPSYMEGRDVKRIAVLLPFSHSSKSVRTQASGILAAIEMALFDFQDQNILLLPKDTGGDARKTITVTEQALAEGADIIIGPLFSENVRSAAIVAHREEIPLVSFSNDLSVAGDDIYLMSFQPEEEVSRIVDWTIRQGIDRFAFIAPDNEYSRRVETALRFEVTRRSGIVLGSEFFSENNPAPVDEVSRLTGQIKTALAYGSDKVAIMMPDRGVRLLGVAPLFPYYGIESRKLQYIGTSRWEDPSIWKEPSLNGAAFATTSPEDTKNFNAAFTSVYGRGPTSLASLGYDAASLAMKVISDGQIHKFEFMNKDGILGANGLYRFRSDGSVERGLAILGIQQGGLVMIDESPKTFQPSIN